MAEEKREWRLSRQAYRDIHGANFVEAICPHGIGHHKGVHGCHMSEKTYGHGCCYDAPEDIWNQVSQDSE